MTILYLGPVRSAFEQMLRSHGDTVIRRDDRLAADDPAVATADLMVSYGYRYLLKPEILSQFGDRAVNLHISLLPWNRGADPNLWSFLEDTPRGVTIHRIDASLDTGDIIAQREVMMQSDDTLRTSYDKLTAAIEHLFTEVWPSLRTNTIRSRPQPTGGSYHRSKDKEPYLHLLHSGWDTPVNDLIGKALITEVC